MLKRTPLFDLYKEYGGKTIDFGGWELPVQFSSIKKEHEAVRTAAGLFDVSHMGEVEVSGNDSLSFLQRLMTNDVSALTPGRAQYTAMCYPDGGTVDDLLIYQKGENRYLLVINASNIDKDLAWMKEHAAGDVQIDNQSDRSKFFLLTRESYILLESVQLQPFFRDQPHLLKSLSRSFFQPLFAPLQAGGGAA